VINRGFYIEDLLNKGKKERLSFESDSFIMPSSEEVTNVSFDEEVDVLSWQHQLPAGVDLHSLALDEDGAAGTGGGLAKRLTADHLERIRRRFRDGARRKRKVTTKDTTEANSMLSSTGMPKSER